MKAFLTRLPVHLDASAQVLAALALAAPAFAGVPEPHQCRDLPVTVAEATPADAASICKGAGAAIAFFRSQKLAIAPAIRVTVREELPPEAGDTALGAFSQAENIVFLLPYRRFKQSKTFTVASTRNFYVSIAVHEVAHALGAFNSSVRDPSVQAREYVAFVTMFSTMERRTKARVLEAYTAASLEPTRQPTPVLYMFNPMAFGVSSYRHFIQLEDGPGFLTEVLAGRALSD